MNFFIARSRCRVGATAYLREQLLPDLDEDAAAVGERFWQKLETRHIPESLSGSSPKQTRHE